MKDSIQLAQLILGDDAVRLARANGSHPLSKENFGADLEVCVLHPVWVLDMSPKLVESSILFQCAADAEVGCASP